MNCEDCQRIPLTTLYKSRIRYPKYPNVEVADATKTLCIDCICGYINIGGTVSIDRVVKPIGRSR